MIRAFELAVRQLGDPRLRVVIWQSLGLSLLLQVNNLDNEPYRETFDADGNPVGPGRKR